MNEQQLAAVKQALEALEICEQDGYIPVRLTRDAITALQSIISQDALDKKADNARELGLSYDDAIKGGVGIMLGGKRIDPASIYAEPKIGCVNHDCDQCKAVQEPVALIYVKNGHWIDTPRADVKGLEDGLHSLYTTPPTPQLVPVKTYHDGKPWPVAPKPWVGLTEKELYAVRGPMSPEEIARAIEAILKEKNA